MPEMMTCPSIAGVTTTFTTTMPGRAGRLAACPGRGREERLALRQVVGPDGDLLFLLPLERHHLVRDLESVRIDLVVAEDRAHLQLQQLLANLVGVEAVGALDRKSTRLNSSHLVISYAVFCLKKKKKKI